MNSTEALTKEGEEFAKNTQLREIKEVRGGKGERVCVGEERGEREQIDCLIHVLKKKFFSLSLKHTHTVIK